MENEEEREREREQHEGKNIEHSDGEQKTNGSPQISTVDKYSSETNWKCINYGYFGRRCLETPHKSNAKHIIQNAERWI